MTTKDFQVGDTVYESVVFFDHSGATAYIEEMAVVLPEDGIVRTRGGSVRTVMFSATLHATAQEAREAAAARLRSRAESLLKQAADLAEPRVVTV